MEDEKEEVPIPQETDAQNTEQTEPTVISEHKTDEAATMPGTEPSTKAPVTTTHPKPTPAAITTETTISKTVPKITSITAPQSTLKTAPQSITKTAPQSTPQTAPQSMPKTTSQIKPKAASLPKALTHETTTEPSTLTPSQTQTVQQGMTRLTKI